MREVSTGADAALWGVLDTARDTRIPRLIRAYAPVAYPLLDPPVARDLAGVLPWLVHLVRGGRLLDIWRREGIGSAWGIAAATHAPADEVLRHLRKLFRATLPDGRVAYFRFYDPRVLRPFLAVTDAPGRRTLFGPLNTIFVESAGGYPVQALRLNPAGEVVPA